MKNINIYSQKKLQNNIYKSTNKGHHIQEKICKIQNTGTFS